MSPYEEFVDLISRLRATNGKGDPWSLEQTHKSMRQDLLDELYECIDAIDQNDMSLLKEEIGDVLFSLFLEAQIAKDQGHFSIEDCFKGVTEKMKTRCPHVFADEKGIHTFDEALSKFEEMKKKEKAERSSALEGVPASMPSLMHAQKIQKRAARVKFEFENVQQILDTLKSEIKEVEEVLDDPDKLEDEIGDLLFSAVNLARFQKIDAEKACARSTQKFIRRFQWIEQHVKSLNKSMEECSLKDLEEYWQKAKQLV
jgi:tetrapyrrole methylase family protein/MazG family protein